MSEDVHIKIDSSKSLKYSTLNDDISSIFYKKGYTSIFIAAACVGYHSGKRSPLPPGKGSSDLFITSTLGSGNSEKLWILKSIAITELGIGALKDFRSSMKICQEYANYGIDLLYDMHTDSENEMIDYSRMMKDILDAELDST